MNIHSIKKAIEEIHALLREQVDSVGAIEWEAESFDQGNVVIDHQHYGKGIGIISDPGSQDNYVEYALEVPRDGDYFLEVRMAAKVARPGRLLWDGVWRKTPFCRRRPVAGCRSTSNGCVWE